LMSFARIFWIGTVVETSENGGTGSEWSEVRNPKGYGSRGKVLYENNQATHRTVLLLYQEGQYAMLP